jgi:2-phospho-L-lactate guanylyltransferase
MKVAVLIPVKGFAGAKQRLVALLNRSERAILAEAMLRDVLAEVAKATSADERFVVTGDSEVSRIALASGFGVIREEAERGETEAVTFALEELARRGWEGALVLPADIPLTRAADIESLLGQSRGRGAGTPFGLLVPARDYMGTNALLLAPPRLIDLRFGHDSFTFHRGRIIAQAGACRVVENERIGLDIDEPRDLERLAMLPARCETQRILAAMRTRSGRATIQRRVEL